MSPRPFPAALAACLALVLCWSGTAAARDWFVATNGNDAWNTPGTMASPFKTIARATWEGFAGPGDRILVRGGTYLLTGGEWVGAGGAAGNPLTIEPYQGEPVILDGAAMGSGSVLGIGASHVVVQGFEVRNSPRTGIGVWGGDPGQAGIEGIVVRANLIHDCQRGGIFVGHAIAETTTSTSTAAPKPAMRAIWSIRPATAPISGSSAASGCRPPACRSPTRMRAVGPIPSGPRTM